MAASEHKEVDTQIDQWLNEGIIQTSVSDYANPIVLVKKKNGETRICVDYRKLNEKVVKTRYPLPIIEDQIDFLIRNVESSIHNLSCVICVDSAPIIAGSY